MNKIYQHRFFPYLLISLLVIAIYSQTVFFDFSSHDDVELLVEKAHFLKDPANILKAFATDVVWGNRGIYYRPALTLSFMTDTLIGGTRPFIFHLGNILIHLLACCLLYLFLKTLKIGKPAALVAALLFAIHPVLIQAVAWIPGRNDSLLTAFVLLSSLCFLNYRRGGRILWGLLHILSFFLALLTKETAVLLPVLLILYSFLHREKGEKLLDKRFFLSMVGWITAAAAYLLLRTSALNGDAGLTDARMNTFRESLIGFVSYIGKIFLPINLSGDPIPADLPVAYGIAGLVVLLAGIFYLKIKNKKLFLFGIFWFLLFLAPTFLGNTTYANFAEHRLYLPLIGFAIMLLQIDSDKLKRLPVPVARSIMILIFILFAGINLTYSRSFRSGLAHWKKTAEVSPHSYVAHTILGRSYANLGKADLAEKEFITAFGLNPKHYTAYNDLCLLYIQKGEYQKAERLALDLLNREPGNAGMHNTLGLVYLNAGRPDLAESQFLKSVELGLDKAEAADNLGYLYLKKGDWGRAEKYLLQAHRISPNDSKNLYHLSFLYHSVGDRARALEYYHTAVKNGLKKDPRVLEMLEGSK
ncbi:MAG: tetratricopeptide repeat protein [Candidatus Edwardsbacteria bacterium]|nr:tetratricopeptide repeat protein [Candidatus Edwardsbacteria bacterium]MBU1577028.1 tetratricopeptide repeat protein [Candidatus Edwardsbacteria bacterium]MBU2464554.1 tetratricopeptide repeat protein [Candidatus Edwardsbacteria bacterium]MBU2593417.1 tetratricopeptide repeat protein [Candidatus Edwardsbacteria bacterium]